MTERLEPDRIRFQRPSFPTASRIERYFDLSRGQRWFSNGGPCWRLLRDRLADRVGAYCVPVASGTAGLMATIAAALSEHGESTHARRALLPSFTFPATAQAALWCGLEPNLIDIDPCHWHLDPSVLEAILLDPRWRPTVVLAVSTFGTPPPVETRSRWEHACRSAGVPLIIDSAAGFGAIADDDTPVGRQGDAEVVSFHATKPFAIGEGGAVFTRSRALRDGIELAINFGLGPDRSVGVTLGLNGKMSELHAATALAVLDEFDGILDQRRRTAASIAAEAGPHVSWQEGCERSTWQFIPVAFVDADHRRQVLTLFRDRLEIRTYYEPLHEMASFRHWPVVGDGLPRTAELHDRIACLPMANDLTESERQVIATALRSERPTERDPVRQ